MSDGKVMLAIHNSSELKRLTNNAKIRSSLKFLLIRYFTWITCNDLSTMDGKTRPGQSQSLTVGVRKIVWKCLVWPGVLDTLTTYKKNHNECILTCPYKNGQKNLHNIQRRIQDGRPPSQFKKNWGFVFVNVYCITGIYFDFNQYAMLQYVFYSLLLLQTCVKGHQNKLQT